MDRVWDRSEAWLTADDLEAGRYAVSESMWGLCHREYL